MQRVGAGATDAGVFDSAALFGINLRKGMFHAAANRASKQTVDNNG